MKRKFVRIACGFFALGLVLVAWGFPPLSAASISALVLRLYLMITARRKRVHRMTALVASAPAIARHLASHLRMGNSLSDSFGPAARGAAQAGDTAAAEFLHGAERRIRLGAVPDEALRSSLAAVSGGQVPPVQLSGLCQMIATLQFDVAVLAASLERTAASLEADARFKRRSRSEMTETRFVSAAIVIFSAAVCTLLSAADPAVATAALTPPGIYLVLGAAALACSGVLSVFRITAIPL